VGSSSSSSDIKVAADTAPVCSALGEIWPNPLPDVTDISCDSDCFVLGTLLRVSYENYQRSFYTIRVGSDKFRVNIHPAIAQAKSFATFSLRLNELILEEPQIYIHGKVVASDAVIKQDCVKFGLRPDVVIEVSDPSHFVKLVMAPTTAHVPYMLPGQLDPIVVGSVLPTSRNTLFVLDFDKAGEKFPVWFQTVIAALNEQLPMTLFFGVRRDGYVVGVPRSKDPLNLWGETIGNVRPNIDYEFVNPYRGSPNPACHVRIAVYNIVGHARDLWKVELDGRRLKTVCFPLPSSANYHVRQGSSTKPGEFDDFVSGIARLSQSKQVQERKNTWKDIKVTPWAESDLSKLLGKSEDAFTEFKDISLAQNPVQEVRDYLEGKYITGFLNSMGPDQTARFWVGIHDDGHPIGFCLDTDNPSHPRSLVKFQEAVASALNAIIPSIPSTRVSVDIIRLSLRLDQLLVNENQDIFTIVVPSKLPNDRLQRLRGTLFNIAREDCSDRAGKRNLTKAEYYPALLPMEWLEDVRPEAASISFAVTIPSFQSRKFNLIALKARFLSSIEKEGLCITAVPVGQRNTLAIFKHLYCASILIKSHVSERPFFLSSQPSTFGLLRTENAKIEIGVMTLARQLHVVRQKCGQGDDFASSMMYAVSSEPLRYQRLFIASPLPRELLTPQVVGGFARCPWMGLIDLSTDEAFLAASKDQVADSRYPRTTLSVHSHDDHTISSIPFWLFARGRDGKAACENTSVEWRDRDAWLGSHAPGVENLVKTFFQRHQLTKSKVTIIVLWSSECDHERRLLNHLKYILDQVQTACPNCRLQIVNTNPDDSDLLRTSLNISSVVETSLDAFFSRMEKLFPAPREGGEISKQKWHAQQLQGYFDYVNWEIKKKSSPEEFNEFLYGQQPVPWPLVLQTVERVGFDAALQVARTALEECKTYGNVRQIAWESDAGAGSTTCARLLCKRLAMDYDVLWAQCFPINAATYESLKELSDGSPLLIVVDIACSAEVLNQFRQNLQKESVSATILVPNMGSFADDKIEGLHSPTPFPKPFLHEDEFIAFESLFEGAAVSIDEFQSFAEAASNEEDLRRPELFSVYASFGAHTEPASSRIQTVVKRFVARHIIDLESSELLILQKLAFAKYYGHVGLPVPFFELEIPENDLAMVLPEPLRVLYTKSNDLFPDSWCIVHHSVAKAILTAFPYQPRGMEEGTNSLSTLALKMGERIVASLDRTSPHSQDLAARIFLKATRRREYSQLLEDLIAETSATTAVGFLRDLAVVFKNWPNSRAHTLAHTARLLAKERLFREAKDQAQEAMLLEPSVSTKWDKSILHNMVGHIHSLSVQDQCSECETIDGLSQICDEAKLAGQSFEKSRELSSQNAHAFDADIRARLCVLQVVKKIRVAPDNAYLRDCFAITSELLCHDVTRQLPAYDALVKELQTTVNVSDQIKYFEEQLRVSTNQDSIRVQSWKHGFAQAVILGITLRLDEIATPERLTLAKKYLLSTITSSNYEKDADIRSYLNLVRYRTGNMVEFRAMIQKWTTKKTSEWSLYYATIIGTLDLLNEQHKSTHDLIQKTIALRDRTQSWPKRNYCWEWLKFDEQARQYIALPSSSVVTSLEHIQRGTHFDELEQVLGRQSMLVSSTMFDQGGKLWIELTSGIRVYAFRDHISHPGKYRLRAPTRWTVAHYVGFSFAGLISWASRRTKDRFQSAAATEPNYSELPDPANFGPVKK
jgi:hypothetical protein